MIDSIILSPNNTKPKIGKLYAVVSIKESGEGLCAFTPNQFTFQTVTSDKEIGMAMFEKLRSKDIEDTQIELREFVFSKVIKLMGFKSGVDYVCALQSVLPSIE